MDALNQALGSFRHDHLLKLLWGHCEDGHYENDKTLVLDGTLRILVGRQPRITNSDDWRIERISLGPDAHILPAYLRPAIHEILRVVDSRERRSQSFKLATDTVFSGLFGHEQARIVGKEDELSLTINYDGYDEAQDWSPRTKHTLRLLNASAATSMAEPIAQLFMLYSRVFVEIGETLSLEESAAVTAGQPSRTLEKLRAVRGHSTWYYHDNERALDLDALDFALTAFPRLPAGAQTRLRRSLHWVGRFQGMRTSDYLLFSAIGVEALIDNPTLDTCEACGSKKFAQGATDAYRQFLQEHWGADAETARKVAKALYSARSKIVHQGRLSSFDDPGTPFKRSFSRGDDLTRFLMPVRVIQDLWPRVISSWLRRKTLTSPDTAHV